MQRRDRTPAVPRLARGWATALLGFVVLLAVTAYYPFDWDPPRTVRNDVTRTADGALRFGESNAANSQGTLVWLEEARATGRVEVDLEVRPLVAQVHGPLSIMLATNYWQTDFAIGQNRSDLLVWLRRLGSDGDGGPAFVVSDVFHARRWTRLRLRVEGANLRIDVDSTMRFLEPVPKGSLRQWGDARVALGGKPGGGGAWPGEIRKAEIRTGGHAVDYVRPGALAVPARYLYFPDRIAPFPPSSGIEWAIVLLHFGSFVVIGSLVVVAWRPPARPVPATLVASGIAVILLAGKFVFHGRHASVADIVVEPVGGLLGVLLARRAVTHRVGYDRRHRVARQR